MGSGGHHCVYDCEDDVGLFVHAVTTSAHNVSSPRDGKCVWGGPYLPSSVDAPWGNCKLLHSTGIAWANGDREPRPRSAEIRVMETQDLHGDKRLEPRSGFFCPDTRGRGLQLADVCVAIEISCRRREARVQVGGTTALIREALHRKYKTGNIRRGRYGSIKQHVAQLCPPSRSGR